ncbi:UvrD-helicase domain-containing protein [Leucobacter sp. HNU]|uniref:UvrD-helicase domain-containing protein n=1 Tax=Leucobacter sp. HNU TaxID=3236805 RepID=UPI003A807E5F
MSPQPHEHADGGDAIVPVFAPLRIAELLAGPDGQILAPTAEQRRVIEHPLAGSALVIAGAGSGKTETMANRVVWLVANGLVAPEQVLGLTFTRKAAGELGERISRRLAGFSAALGDAEERGLLSPPEIARAAALREQLSDGLDLPSVSTYHSFAASVVQEFGAAAGLASDAALIDEASAWRIAREVVLASDDPALLDDDRSVAQLVSQVLRMDHEVADHLTSLERVDLVIDEFARVVELPYSEKEIGKPPTGKVYAPVRDAVADVRSTALITRLARAYAEEKRRRGLMEFSDQLALAVRILDAAPDAVAALRRRSRAVLLDEVQDTSVGQTRLLSRIFAGLPVMAVGDPHQSIYGWRGASAEGLESFHRDFRGRGPSAPQRSPCPPAGATPSWCSARPTCSRARCAPRLQSTSPSSRRDPVRRREPSRSPIPRRCTRSRRRSPTGCGTHAPRTGRRRASGPPPRSSAAIGGSCRPSRARSRIAACRTASWGSAVC